MKTILSDNPIFSRQLVEAKPALDELCERYHVESLYLFGSVLTPHFRTESDLDFLVTFKGVDLESYANNFFDFTEALHSLFGRKIDLVESQTLQNPYFREVVNSTKKLVYATGQSVQMVA
jgi:hypothetical protein